MSTIRKISTSGTSNFKSMFNAAWSLIKSTADANHVHIVYDMLAWRIRNRDVIEYMEVLR